MGDFGLALPTIPLRVIIPDGSALDTLSTSILDADAIGASVIAALDYVVSERESSDIHDCKKTRSEFLDGMERFRKTVGVGKRRFERRLGKLVITRKTGEIVVKKTNQAHGRFAFEGTMLASGQVTVSAPAAQRDIGQAVQALLGKETQHSGN